VRILEAAVSGTVGTVDMGPVSTVICELSNNFTLLGHEVVLADIPSRTPRSLLSPQVRVVEIAATGESTIEAQSSNPLAAHVNRWRNYWQYIRQLRALPEYRWADVIHVHHPVPAFLLQRFHGKQACYTAHTPVWSMANPQDRTVKSGGLKAAIRSMVSSFDVWVEKDAIRRSRSSVGLGSYLADAVPGAPVSVIPNGIDLGAWPVIERSAARRELGIADDAFVVVFTGRITHIKGVDVLIEALATAQRRIDKLQAIVIGPLSGRFDSRDSTVEPFARSMMDKAQGLPVRFAGFINNREMLYKQHLAAADLFVLPSRREPQGLVVLEALAMGTPVIGSRTGGIPDMINEDVGYLVEPGDAAGLAACIETAHDSSRLTSMRSAARAHVEQNYGWPAIAKRYLAAFSR